jgi:hypothetical protein
MSTSTEVAAMHLRRRGAMLHKSAMGSDGDDRFKSVW